MRIDWTRSVAEEIDNEWFILKTFRRQSQKDLGSIDKSRERRGSQSESPSVLT